MTFKAFVVEEQSDGSFKGAIKDRELSALPEGEVLIKVMYSSLNYKDALSSIGNRGVTRAYPHTPGIDAAGVIYADSSGTFNEGDEVIVTSYDLGMNTPGGYGQYIRVPVSWVVSKPEGLSLRQCMSYGTAGLTAAISVHKLMSAGVDSGSVLVTGATGGVGSVAVGILAKAGYSVTALSGKPDAVDFLKALGAAEVVGRDAVQSDSKKPLLKQVWDGAVDTVGGDILAATLKSISYGGAVTCCGLVAAAELNTTVLPFILRGVTLLGVDSVSYPMPLRQQLWDKLATVWKFAALDDITREVSLDDLQAEIDSILKGGQKGRVVVKLS
jgi:acrylyl-CoA reductase (NADPH)